MRAADIHQQLGERQIAPRPKRIAQARELVALKKAREVVEREPRRQPCLDTSEQVERRASPSHEAPDARQQLGRIRIVDCVGDNG